MFNKNHKDPLVDAVQAAMQKGAQDRAAIAKVNETFGIQAKRQLPHERHAEYDRAIATALTGGGAVSLTEEVKPQPDTPKVKAARKADVKTQKMVKSVFKKAFKGAKEKEYWEEGRRVDSIGSDAMDDEKKNPDPMRKYEKDAAKLKKVIAAKKKLKEMKEYGVDGERARANPKKEKIKKILKTRLGKGDGTESVEQSRRTDK